MSAVSLVDLVAVAPAVHQVRRAGGADVGVVERLEPRLDVLREVLEVHVVDRVGERALEAERLRRLEARAVLDVALLAAVVPVHRRDLVPVGPDPGGDARRADRRDRREGRDAVVDQRALLDQHLQRRRAPGVDRPLEHRGLHGVDDGEDELLRLRPRGHRRMRSPAYFSPARRRPPNSSASRPPITSTASGGNRTEAPAAQQRRALGVERQRVGGLACRGACACRDSRSRATTRPRHGAQACRR